MGRDIEFRGKRVDNSEWVYGDLIQSFCENKAYIDINHCFDIKHILVNPPIEVDKETVGQFAGLVIDNQKIYEDDILFDEHCEEIYVVSFDEYRFIGSDNTIQYDLCELDYCVHIGNIHDNPELLEVTQNN